MERVLACRKRLLLLWGHESQERRIVTVELPREPMVRGLRFKASSNQLQSIVLSNLPSQGRVLVEGSLKFKRGGLKVGYIT